MRIRLVTILLLILIPAGPALAQVDLSGAWGQRFHEDLPERGAGPEIGDYLGIPVNDAARLRADSWDAGKWTMPERQCEPHPADYGPRGPASMRISSTVDPVSQDVVSWHTTLMWMLPERTIYMDGRPQPSPNAQHTQVGGTIDGIIEGLNRILDINMADRHDGCGRPRISDAGIRHQLAIQKRAGYVQVESASLRDSRSGCVQMTILRLKPVFFNGPLPFLKSSRAPRRPRPIVFSITRSTPSQ